MGRYALCTCIHRECYRFFFHAYEYAFLIQMDSYAVPLVEVVEEAVRKYSVATDSVINFGCATGLNSFLLSTIFQKVHVRTCMCEG